MKSYFTIEELCKSETADLYNIDNTPSDDIIVHLKMLIDFLNPIREAWGSAIIVTSGYRCPELNKLIGGSKTSVHKIGFAVDIVPKNGNIEKFKDFILDYFQSNNISWDQLLLEYNKTSVWIHIGLYNNYLQQRRQIKYLCN